jgi:flagellar hook-associated protein 2
MSSINLINSQIDVASIVDALIASESTPVTRMQNNVSSLQTKINAYQSINTKLASLLTKADAVVYNGSTAPLRTPGSFLDRFENSIFTNRTVTSSNNDVITAAASHGTASGTYSITVSNLATAKSVAADNFADVDTTSIGTGTFVITAGSSDPVTITIDSSNNTLDGIRKAINAADAGVNATIINDGSGTPYRLLVTAKDTGTASTFSITDNLSGGKALNLTQKVAAEDATFEVNGIAITKSSNTITDVIDGVSFTLHDESASAVKLTVGNDVEGIVTALQNLASAYNDLNSAISSQSQYNSTTKTAGVLSGDSTLRSIQSRVQSTLSQSVSNSFTNYSVLSQVGFSFNNNGSIAVDASKLRTALNTDITKVAALFLGDGAISDSRVSYDSQAGATQAGTYAVAVTTLATQAAVSGDRAVTTLDLGSNPYERLTITGSGSSTPVNVDLLTGDTLSDVLSKINTALTAGGLAMTAADDGSGKIKFVSANYGSDQTVTVTSNLDSAAGTSGFGTSAASGTGTNIAGTINGHAATGTGLKLTGASGQPEEGLVLTISQTSTGSYGTIKIAAGFTYADGNSPLVNLRSALDTITDSLSGPIHNATDALSSNITNLKKRITEYQERLDIRRELLTREYTAADTALRQLQVTQSSLSSQTASLSKIG